MDTVLGFLYIQASAEKVDSPSCYKVILMQNSQFKFIKITPI